MSNYLDAHYLQDKYLNLDGYSIRLRRHNTNLDHISRWAAIIEHECNQAPVGYAILNGTQIVCHTCKSSIPNEIIAVWKLLCADQIEGR